MSKLKEYIGDAKTYAMNETVKAKPMTRLRYNMLRGWELPEDENGNDEGYVILRDTGHVNWLPKREFQIVAFDVDNEFMDVRD